MSETEAAADLPQLRITHGTIFRRHWASILLTLCLILISTGVWLMQPFVLGLAINDLTEGSWRGTIFLAALQVTVLLVGGVRRFIDTRVYGRIYREIATETVNASQEAGVELTRIAARASLLREVVQFFEFRIPNTLRSFVNLVGSLALLAVLVLPVFYACLGALAVMVLITLAVQRRLLRLNRGLNDELEMEVDVFGRADSDATAAHFEKVTRFNVARSDVEVVMYGLLSVVLTGTLLFALYWVVSVVQAEIGTVFSVFSYVVRFQMAVNTFPRTYEDMLRTFEITKRVNDLTGGRRPKKTKRQKAPLEEVTTASLPSDRQTPEEQTARLIALMTNTVRRPR